MTSADASPTPVPYPYDEPEIAAVLRDRQARLAVYPFSERAVVLGRASRVDAELCVASIAADQLPLYRRRGGGCAVVLDPGNVIVTVGLPLPGLKGSREMFDAITDWLLAALERLGLPDVYSDGVSDLVLGGRKFAGSCVYRANNLLFYSASLLIQPDLALLERYLRHPPREPDYRRGRTHRDFVTTLAQSLPWATPERFAQRLREQLSLDGLLEKR